MGADQDYKKNLIFHSFLIKWGGTNYYFNMLQLTEIMVKAKEREQLVKMLFFLSHIFGLQILQTDELQS